MFEIILVIFFAILIVAIASNWPVKIYDVGAGVRLNLENIRAQLDKLGIIYTYEFPVDGSRDIDLKVEVAPGLAGKRRVPAEVAWGIIKIRQTIGGQDVEKAICVGGYSQPRPLIRISLTPLHCWGFDPPALTIFSRDPKHSQTEYDVPILPKNIASQTLSPEIIDIAVRYASWPVPDNLYKMHKDAA